MPTAKTAKSVKTAKARAAMVRSKPTPRTPSKAPARRGFADTMRVLEQAGSAQTRKTYARHGATEPMFGVSFATLKTLVKQIGVDHELALQLWDSGNFDARNLAVKVADPARLSADDLDRWARVTTPRMCGGYVAMLAAEGPSAQTKLTEWLGAKDAHLRATGWTLLGQLAHRHEALPDALFAERLAAIERTIHSAANVEREAMNQAVIAIGGRSPGLRKAALAASKRIGTVEVDHGDTACQTPDAAVYIEKAWGHATAKGFASPAAQERARETPRLRC